MKRLDFVYSDAVALRGIVDYLEKAEGPIRTNELAMTQHIGDPAALRLCKVLEKAGHIEHPVVTRIVFGVNQQVPQLGWKLTLKCRVMECTFDAEALARGA